VKFLQNKSNCLPGPHSYMIVIVIGMWCNFGGMVVVVQQI